MNVSSPLKLNTQISLSKLFFKSPSAPGFHFVVCLWPSSISCKGTLFPTDSTNKISLRKFMALKNCFTRPEIAKHSY